MAGIRSVYSYYAVLSAAGTYVWYKPVAAKLIKVQLWGAGAGGNGGANLGNQGGAGGQGGCCVIKYLSASVILTRTVTIVVGAGGIGGNPNGGAGSPGGNTTFGSFLTAYGGGIAGGAITGAAGAYLPSQGTPAVCGQAPYYATAGWGAEYSGGDWNSGGSIFSGGGGGAGATATGNGSVGGARGYYNGLNGGSPGVYPGGTAPSCAGTWKGGGGGGGSDLFNPNVAGNGGKGGWASGGGGGGASSHWAGGYGGAGGPGYAVIQVYF